jgi:hypothetical protein
LATSASLASVAIVPDAAAPAAATSTIKVELAAINTIAMWNVRCGKRNTLRANAATCYKFYALFIDRRRSSRAEVEPRRLPRRVRRRISETQNFSRWRHAAAMPDGSSHRGSGDGLWTGLTAIAA